MWPNTYPSHEHRPDDYPVTPVLQMPLRACQPLSQRVACADALDRVIEQYGLRAVLFAISNVVAANGCDPFTQTISDLAQIAEQQ